ncbi:MAG: GNAT family N-acetyltransferase [Phycisphaerales bacterium]
MFTLREPIDAKGLAEARAIFAEYGASIATAAGCSLEHQGFDGELATLPGKYAPPSGAIILAYEGPAVPPVAPPVGCVALRPLAALGDGVCELKRMYVRPIARRQGLGLLLCQAILERARVAGYTLIKLDTDAGFHAAITLYTSVGFVPCTRYNDDPMDDTLWFEMRL